MTAVHPRDLVDTVLGLTQKVKDLQGQLSAATPKLGTATLVAGAVTVTMTGVTAASKVLVGTVTPGGTPGALFVFAKTPGSGFVIHSTSGTDTSVVAYAVY